MPISTKHLLPWNSYGGHGYLWGRMDMSTRTPSIEMETTRGSRKLRWVLMNRLTMDSRTSQLWIFGLLMSFFHVCKVDASAGKDKLVGKVTSGIADLLGKTRSFLSQVSHKSNSLSFSSQNIRISLRELLQRRIHDPCPSERPHIFHLRWPRLYILSCTVVFPEGRQETWICGPWRGGSDRGHMGWNWRCREG